MPVLVFSLFSFTILNNAVISFLTIALPIVKIVSSEYLSRGGNFWIQQGIFFMALVTYQKKCLGNAQVCVMRKPIKNHNDIANS